MNSTLRTILIVLVALVLVFGCLGGAAYSEYAKVRAKGKNYENTMSAQYRSCQVVYSSYTAAFHEKFGVMTAGLKSFDTIMSDAIKGRYDSTDAQGNPSGTINTSFLLKAVVEQYPNLTGVTDLVKNMSDFVQSRRADFADCQNKLVDMNSQFGNFLTQDPIESMVASWIGFPDRDLVAQIGTQKWYGTEARDKMMQLVLTSDALNAYTTGQDVPLMTPAP